MRIHAVMSALALAALTLVATAENLPGERSPGDMSVAERTHMMQSTNDYNNCVYKAAIDKINADPDIRRIADAAMVVCQPQIDALRKLIVGWRFPEYFAEGFARSVRERAAHNLLPELATRKSN